ncbi:helix-turn-helix domain-containing protein [Lactococcus garvieae]|uniref:helix-turn-helix domain-containing protein n=1 Tax=Lactococcus garvieae TaxID=1363 RepID=UPI0038540D27
MNLYEKIKELAAQKKLSIRRLEEELGFANGSLKQWKNSNPGADKLARVAKYFNVSVDYLLGLDTTKPKQTKVDLAAVADDDEPNWDDWLSAGGKPLTESDKIALKLMFYGRGKSGKK